MVEWIRANRDARRFYDAQASVRLMRYRPGQIEFETCWDAAQDLPQRLGKPLQGGTGAPWGIAVVPEGGSPTLLSTLSAERLQIENGPCTTAHTGSALRIFPGAKLLKARIPANSQAKSDALDQVEDGKGKAFGDD